MAGGAAPATLNLTIATEDRTFTLSIDAAETIENVKALIEVETGVLVKDQVILYQGRELASTLSLAGGGVQDGEVLFVTSKEALHTDNEAQDMWDPAQVQRYFRNNPDQLQQLLHNNPTMAEAVLSDDLSLLTNLLAQRQAEKRKADLERALRTVQLEADPFDPRAQQMIEEEIRQENIKENMESAIEHNPEAFGRVVMLYIDCEVNKTAVKAFVDSGAQSTIMSKECADRCGIGRLIDTRWAGLARGVGTAKIIGRVHVAPIKIGRSFFSSSFTILEDNQGTDLLLGLDMLRKHQCIIDLKDTVLRIGDEVVPFLSEKDIPRNIRFEEPPEESSSSSPSSVPTTSTPPAPVVVPPASREQPSPSVASGLPAGVTEHMVKQLTDLGYSRQEAIRALALFNGNVELAASSLFGAQSFGF